LHRRVAAVLLLVLGPLGLLAASLRHADRRSHLLAYWRASSLLMITVYLMIDGRPLAFVTGHAALVCIPLALYMDGALHVADRAQRPQHGLDRWFRGWRRAATGFCGLSLLLTLPALADAAQIAGGVYGVYLVASIGIVVRATERR
jgi:hypothetical protein